MFSVRIETDDFLADLAKCETNMDQALGFAWAEQGASAAQACKHNGYKDRTGNLSNSMNYAIQKNGPLAYRLIISAGAYYALWVNKSTRPHRIPKWGYAHLRFYSAKFGRFVFASHVWHPGTKGANWTDRIMIKYGGFGSGGLIPIALQAAVDRVAAAA
ncbi:MAG: hypothetical protein WC563_15540 [Brevundimonas sp.]